MLLISLLEPIVGHSWDCRGVSNQNHVGMYADDHEQSGRDPRVVHTVMQHSIDVIISGFLLAVLPDIMRRQVKYHVLLLQLRLRDH